jgi:predicted ATPase/DNA-binding winged helix-turn-helix (wHTH) protein
LAAQRRRLDEDPGPWEMDLTRRELRTHGIPVPLGGRAFDIVEVLARSAGELVTKDEIMRRVWSGAVVEESALQVHISAIRKAFGSDRGMLKTAFGRGYRLLGAWTIRQERISAAPVVLQIVTPTTFSTNFPSASFDLIGRSSAVRHLQDLLSAYRVVTLTGPGGIGKSALALAVARSLFPLFQGDGWLVELASLSDPELVPSAVASVLDLKLGGDEISAEKVARVIGDKKLLLILDNCEHVIDAAAELAEAVVRLCPRTTVLGTSREVLRIDGEYVYRVPPLDVPPEDQTEPEMILEHDAVELLIARTRTLDPDISLHGENLPAIASICRHLDGIPLAIEFAAARAATLGVQQVATHLDDRFRFLTSGRRTALPRHRTLRAMLDWSYELLPDEERLLLRRLGIFSAGFTFDAAVAVMQDTGLDVSAVTDGIGNLVAKSLVALNKSDEVTRWSLLETIRAYALEKLAEHAEVETTARHHAAYFRDRFAPRASGSRSGLSNEDLMRRVREIDNVRTALDWSFSPLGDVAIGIALTAAYVPVWLNFSMLVECRERTEHALNSVEPHSTQSAQHRMQLQLALGTSLAITMGSAERSKLVLSAALETAESLDDLEAQLLALWGLWSVRFDQSIAERFFHAASRNENLTIVRVAHRILGSSLHHTGNQGEARSHFERALELCVPETRGPSWWFLYDQRVLARAMLARTLWLQGFVEQAETIAQASLTEALTTGKELTLCYVIALAVCPIALMTGDHTAAERALTMLIDTATKHSFRQYTKQGRFLEGMLLIKRRQFDVGTTLLRTALETDERDGWKSSYPTYLGFLSEGLAGLAQIAEALTTVDEARARAEDQGELWYVAELLRIKGELLLQQGSDGSTAATEDCLNRAGEIASEQGALFWELRVALSLARLRLTQGRNNEARQVLGPVYDRFTEGFDTSDLRSARTLLESLPSN